MKTNGEGTSDSLVGAESQRTHPLYPVRTVARLTGLSPDIIRVWEKRYGVVAPVRGPRGTRLYGQEDVERLRLLARVVRSGRAIGDVARLDVAEIRVLANQEMPRPGDGGGSTVAQLVGALERSDTTAVERQLREALVALGSAAFVGEIAAPLLCEVGEAWSAGRVSIADGHFLSGVLRGLLTGLIQTGARDAERSVVLATPSGERHEFGLLFTAFFVADAGIRVYYLGVDLPAAEIVRVVGRHRIDVVGLGVAHRANRERAIAEVDVVARGLPRHVELWLGGPDATAVARGALGCQPVVVTDFDSLSAQLARLCTG